MVGPGCQKQYNKPGSEVIKYTETKSNTTTNNHNQQNMSGQTAIKYAGAEANKIYQGQSL